MKIIGIDPGRKGAIVTLDPAKKIAYYSRLPYRKDNIVDFDILNKWKGEFSGSVFLEDVHGKKEWGAQNNFAFGSYFGQLKLWLAIEKIPHILVRPQEWQKIAHMGMGSGDPKQNSYTSFIRLNPNAKISKSEDGIIDAYHIARWGLIYYTRNVAFTDNWRFDVYE